MTIDEMTRADFDSFWPAFRVIIAAQETYALDPDMGVEEAYQFWCLSSQVSYGMKQKETLLGCYFLRPNAAGPSSHIANCGYMVDPEARGKGVARALCIHSQEVALMLGYSAMQFNSVVSSNEVAVSLWKKLGFKIIGTG